MEIIAISLLFFLSAYLLVEKRRNDQTRSKLKHVIHVNGIRGKSTTTRLIQAALQAGGYRVFCKTTGTVPMMIDGDNQEHPILRKGPANINEQIRVMRKAVADQADILVIECMAVNPRLQKISQEQILQADIGVITNVRLDHTEEMGASLDLIAHSLSSTIPKAGSLVTAEKKELPVLRKEAEQRESQLLSVQGKEIYAGIDFPENVACALGVCELLGIGENSALQAMRSFIPDPYALFSCRLPSGAIFINGLSINDPDSSFEAYQRESFRLQLKNKKLVLLINNRPDRGYRAKHMLLLSQRLRPDLILLKGAYQQAMAKKLAKFTVEKISSVNHLLLTRFAEDDVIFAVGNIANGGAEIIDYIRKVKVTYV